MFSSFLPPSQGASVQSHCFKIRLRRHQLRGQIVPLKPRGLRIFNFKSDCAEPAAAGGCRLVHANKRELGGGAGSQVPWPHAGFPSAWVRRRIFLRSGCPPVAGAMDALFRPRPGPDPDLIRISVPDAPTARGNAASGQISSSRFWPDFQLQMRLRRAAMPLPARFPGGVAQVGAYLRTYAYLRSGGQVLCR